MLRTRIGLLKGKMKPEVWSMFLQFSAFAFLLFGIKLWLIGNYGNPTPFWDQWDGEAAMLYKPFLSGKLTLADLLSTHNEHRILTTRLFALALLKINTIWNPMLQMAANAALHIITLALGVFLLAKVIGRQHLPALLAFSVILFGIPFSWENTLSGFQSQFYFVQLFSIASLWLISVREPFSSGWWLGLTCAILAFFSLASGLFAFGAATCISFIVFITNQRRTPRQLSAVAILLILFIACIKLTPALPGHAAFKATSFHQFYVALTGILGWPAAAGFFSAFLWNLPALIFIIQILRKPPKANDRRWFLLALIFWCFGQAFSLAYGRASMSIGSRYIDLFCMNIVVNFACLLFILQNQNVKWRSISFAFGAIWPIIILFSVFRMGIQQVPVELTAKRAGSLTQELNTRNYLATGDTAFIRNKPLLDIPYPDPNRFALILSWPEIRSILPANINPGLNPVSIHSNPTDAFVKNGYYLSTPKLRSNDWGSYTGIGDNSIGEFSATYDAGSKGGRILVPVAGYPLNEGIKFEIEQNGQRRPLIVPFNPKESWGMADAKVGSGPFTIYVKDSSKTTWLAVSNPTFNGRLDHLIFRLHSHAFLFILSGVVLFVLLIITNGFRHKTLA